MSERVKNMVENKTCGRCKWITAHSGCEGKPDNSEAHIRAAAASGADVLEIDVRRVQGDLLLTHNEPEDPASCVSLKECFRLVKELSGQIRINCDLKHEGLERDVLALAEQEKMQGRIILTGTVAPELLKTMPEWVMVSMNVENLLPGVYEAAEARGELRMTEEEETLLLEKARRYGVSSLNMNYRYFHRDLWQKMADAGIAFSLWTANDEETIRRLLAYDLENLTTRMPVFACRMRAELAGNPCR